MNYKTHRVGGLCFSLISMMCILPFLKATSDNDEIKTILIIVAMIGGLIGGLLPDLDEPNSKASNSLGIITKIISIIINKIFGHREFTHTIWFIIIIVLPLGYFVKYLLFPLNIIYFAFVYGLFWGMISHLILDSITKQQIKPFTPIWDKKIGIPLFKGKNNEVEVSILIIIITLIIIAISSKG